MITVTQDSRLRRARVFLSSGLSQIDEAQKNPEGRASLLEGAARHLCIGLLAIRETLGPAEQAGAEELPVN